jgi:hypothetical protein
LFFAFGILAGLVSGICMLPDEDKGAMNHGVKKGLRGAPHKVAKFFHFDGSNSKDSSEEEGVRHFEFDDDMNVRHISNFVHNDDDAHSFDMFPGFDDDDAHPAHPNNNNDDDL